jgi:hypothetical protein
MPYIEASGQVYVPADTHPAAGSVGPTAGLDAFRKEKNNFSLWGIEPRFLGGSDRSLFTPPTEVSAEPCSGVTALSGRKVSTGPTGPPSLFAILQALSQIGSTVP